MNKIFSTIAITMLCSSAFSQNEDDALRYSQTFFGGTARSTGMAGAMTAFGGDFSVATENPAGLGRLRKTNFSATFNWENLRTDASFYGQSTTRRGNAGNLSNLSYVKAYELDPKKFNNWYGVQLGMGMTRIKSFNERVNYIGTADSSILHSFINEANGTPESLIYDNFPFTAGLAYDVFAIDPADNNQYTTGFSSGQAIHNRSITRRGGMNEYSFSLSGNYANRLYLGGSFNAIKVNYYENFRHQEAYTVDSLWLQSINYTGTLDIEGWGFNARLGAIYLPNDWFSIGVSAQLPTRFKLSDTYSNNMTSETAEGTKFVDPSFVPKGEYDYVIRTPFRANLSLGAVLESRGSVGLVVEYVDYTNASLEDTPFSEAPYGFTNENAQVDNIYREVLNFRVGGEAKVSEQTYLRGGFAFYPSAFKADKGNNLFPTYFYTAGAGYNMGKYYFDISGVYRQKKEDFFAYDPTINGSTARLDYKHLNVMLTFGIRIL